MAKLSKEEITRALAAAEAEAAQRRVSTLRGLGSTFGDLSPRRGFCRSGATPRQKGARRLTLGIHKIPLWPSSSEVNKASLIQGNQIGSEPLPFSHSHVGKTEVRVIAPMIGGGSTESQYLRGTLPESFGKVTRQ
jgi:hypothetical protein